MAKTNEKDVELETPVADDTEGGVTVDDDAAITDDTTVVDDTASDITTADDDNDSVAGGNEDTATAADDDAATVDDAAGSADDSTNNATEADETHSVSTTSVERKVMHTNRVMKVYAHPSVKARVYTFIGTYTVTGKVCGDFKEIICSVAGLGKFTGFIAL